MTKRKVLAVVSACALLLTMFVSLIPVYAGKPDDTTGWTLGEGSTITGNPDEGWLFKQTAGRDAAHQNKYVTDIPLRDLQVQFIANYADNKLWTINLSDRDLNPLPGVNDLGETGLCLIFEKRNDNTLAVQRWSNGAPGAINGVYLYAQDITFDFSIPHTLHFVEQDGRWYVALDNNIVFKADGMDVTSLLNAMDGKQTVFESAADCNVTFPYINFADGTEIADWQYTSQVTVAGSEERGFTMVGKEGGDGYAVYGQPVSLLNNEFQVRLDFDSNWTYFGFDTVPEVTGENNKLNADIDMQFYIKDGRLDIGLFSGGQPVTDKLYSIENFDFDAVHVFGFVEDNGQYYLTVDGKRAPYNEILSNHVAEMKDAGVYWRLGAGNGTTVQYFTDIKVLSKIEGWTIGEGSTITANADGGWSFKQANGDQNQYKTDISMRNLRMEFKGDFAESGKWWGVILSDEGLVVLPNSDTLGDTGLCLMIEKNANGTINLQRWSSGTPNTQGGFLYHVRDVPFDFGANHVLHFVEQNSKWYIAIDDIVLDEEIIMYDGNNEPYNAMQTYVEGSQDVSAILEAMGDTPTVFSSSAACDVNLTYINFTEAEESYDPASEWKLNGSATIEGDATNGFTLVGDRGVEAKYQEAIDLSTQSVRLKFNHTTAWQAVNFTTTSNPTGLVDASSDNLTMLFSFNGETTLRVSVWLGGEEAESAIAYIDNFDRNAEHTVGFTKRENNWYLNFDGVVYTSPAEESKGITARLTQALDNMTVNTAYAGLHSYGGEQGTEINVSGFRFVNTTVSQVGDWRLNGTVTIEDNGENGFNLAGSGGVQAKYQKPIDLSTQSVKLQLNHTSEWQGINFTTSREPNGVTNPSEDALTLILGREGNELRASIWIGDVAGGESQGEGCVVRIPDFAWNEEHTFGFSKVEDNWYLNIDGRVYTEPLEGSKGITGYVTAALENMVTVPTYAGVINAENVDLAITGYRYVSTETPEVQTDWRLSGTVTAEGDATNGYNLTGNGKAAYKAPFDLTMKSVTMTFEPGIGQWNALHFGNTDAVSDLDIPTESHLSLVITHGGGNTGIDENTARISLWMEKTKEDGSKYNAEAAIAYLNNFDFSAAHSFGFSEMDGSWYLNVDGKLCTQPDAGVTELITAMVENMAGEDTYVSLQTSGGDFAIEGFRITDTDHPDDDGDWRLSGEATAEGDRENGYTLAGKGYAAYKIPFDMAAWSVKMQFVPTIGGWQSLTFSDICTVDTNILPGLATQGGEHNALTFILGRGTGNEGDAATTDLRLSLYMKYTENGEEREAERAIAYISNFDWEAEHTFGFAKIGDSWYVVVDGKTYTSPQADGADRLITNAITEVLNAMQGKDAYVRAFASDALNMPKFNLVETGRNEQEEGEWELSTDMTAEETANGWTVSGIPGIAGWKEVFAVDQDVFRIQFKPEVGNWAYFSVGDTYSVSAEQFMGPDNANNMICFILGRENETTLRLSMWNGTAESAMVYISNFDFDKTHDFQFVQRRGNWYLSIDGRTILSPQGDGDDKIITSWITEAVNNLKGNEAYIRVSACAGVPITLTNIQMIGEGHDNSSGSQTGVVFPIAAVAALGVSFLAVLVLRKKKA